jgi:hypothetical protein
LASRDEASTYYFWNFVWKLKLNFYFFFILGRYQIFRLVLCKSAYWGTWQLTSKSVTVGCGTTLETVRTRVAVWIFDFLNNQQFQFFKIFRIKEPPLLIIFLKKSESENHILLWLFHKHHRTDNFHERTCKEQMVTKTGFWIFQKFWEQKFCTKTGFFSHPHWVSEYIYPGW